MSAFTEARDAMWRERALRTLANFDAELMGVPLPYPPAPPKPEYLREDDPCDEWGDEWVVYAEDCYW